MKIGVTGRHMEVTDVLKDYTVEKTGHLAHYYDNIQRAEVIYGTERDGQFSAELILHAPRGSVLVVHSHGRTATAAFDSGMEKMERQLAKLKDKLKKTAKIRPGKGPGEGSPGASGGDNFGDIWW